MDEQDLIRAAAELARPLSLEGEGSAASVAAALVTAAGNLYTGVCVDLRCGLGFCAERTAAAEMLKKRETRIAMLVAVDERGAVIPPCGVCREFLLKVDGDNGEAVVVLGGGARCRLRELLP